MKKLSLISVFDIATMHRLARIILITSALLVLLVSPCLTADAQSATQVAEITRTLSPASQAVIERLSTFYNLPGEEWRFHAGGLAHGETLSLDDSSWPQVKASAGQSQ
jgi:alpha-mannosidase